jgi:DNA repair protein RadA/Sms
MSKITTKEKTLFVCQNCGAESPRWEGKCRDCNSWNSLVEEKSEKATKGSQVWNVAKKSGLIGAHDLAELSGSPSKSGPRLGDHLDLSQDVVIKESSRFNTGLNEFNRVLGGGLVPGSYILLGGDPGIGKSTLLMQMAGKLALQFHKDQSVLYISGEESVEQTALRAQRLGVKDSKVKVASESQLVNILNLTKKLDPTVLIIDSIQTIYSTEITSAPGTVSQVRECAAQLMALAKSENIAVFLVGHITKDGQIAGPKTLEHMVDTVLSFEGDANYQYRLLRAQKNRFGPTNELGVFQMAKEGLEEVANPSELFLAERGESLMGSAVFAAMEGSRPLLCEMQSLNTTSYMAMPRRTSIGFEVNRVHLLTAVLDKHLDCEFARNDVFVNAVGGLKIVEPAADVAVAAAMLSSMNNSELPAQTVFFGEIGLTGEVRASTFAVERIREAEKLGFQAVVLPYGNKKQIEKYGASNLKFLYIKDVRELQRHVGSQIPPR